MKEEAIKPSLYIHVPFCDHVCAYCAFCKMLINKDLEKAYVQALLRDLRDVREKEVKTVYIGGGTPSALSYASLDLILSFISSSFKVEGEFTLEGNPESISEEKAALFKKHGVNRVSLGGQSFKKEALALLDRELTSKEDSLKAVKALHKAGIDNVSMDFIYGLKAMKKEDYLTEIDFGAHLGLTHFSFYALSLEKKTRLNGRTDILKSDDDIAADYSFIRRELKKRGYFRYEVSSFAKTGFKSQHNLTYWHFLPYIGLGMSAVGYYKGHMKTVTSSFKDYVKGGNLFIGDETIGPEEEEFNYLMLNLRLDKGFLLSDFKKRFGRDFKTAYLKEIKELEKRLAVTPSRVYIPPRELYTMDMTLVDLLHFKKE